jgi:hypothetical protein
VYKINIKSENSAKNIDLLQSEFISWLMLLTESKDVNYLLL